MGETDTTMDTRTTELNKVVRYLDEHKIQGMRRNNSLMQETLWIPLPEVKGIAVCVEWLDAGDFRYKVTQVNCRDFTKISELVGAVMTPEYVLRLIVNIRESWWEAHPQEYQEWLYTTFPANLEDVFRDGAEEGRS